MEEKEYNSNVYLLAKSVPIDGSNNPEKIVAGAIKFECTDNDGVALYKDLDNKKASNIIDIINKGGETSYLEHINFTFVIENISKECAYEVLNYALASSTKNNNKTVYNNRNLLVTMNAEDLMDFFYDNCCSLVGKELNEVADKMLNICLYEAPTVFANAGAPCTFEKCDKKDLSCKEKRKAKVKQIIKMY